MPGPITQEYILRGTAQFDDIQQKVNQTQNFLNGLKLPTNLKVSFTQTFTEMGNSIKKASGLLNQGFSSKGQLSSFNKEINNITAGFDRLGKDMAKISLEALERSVPMIQQYKTQLQEISNAAADVEKKMQGKIGEEWEASMKRIVNEMQGLSSSDKIRNFAEQFQAGKLQEADEILKDITRTVGHFKDAGKTNDFKNWCDQARDALEQTQRATVEEQQALTQLGGQAEQVVSSGMNDLTNSVHQQTQAININKSQVQELGNNINVMGQKSVQASTDLDQFKSKLTYFFGLNNGVQLVRRAFTKLIQTMKELDEVMTQTAVVTDYTVGDMWSQLPEITARANELGVAIKSVYEADMLFYQQGLKSNQVLELSNESMKMARIAGLDAKTATDRMTNALRGFNMELDKTNAQRINDVYNALAARTASNVQEISSAMTKVASLANSANMSFENTAAFLAQIVETTRESAETAGTALKTVIARFSEVKKLVSEGELTGQTEEGEEIDVNKVSTALRAANIDLNEYLTGAKGLDQIFMELSSKWDSLDIVTQRYIATMAAGSRQQSRFIALMQDYSRMQELTGIATNANGAAQEQFKKTLESFETVVNRLKNAWNSFLLGLANNEVIKGAINLLTNIINTLGDLIDKLSLGSDMAKTFITAFLSFGAFKIGKALVTKIFSGTSKLFGSVGIMNGRAYNLAIQKTMMKNNLKPALQNYSKSLASLQGAKQNLYQATTKELTLNQQEQVTYYQLNAAAKTTEKAELDVANAKQEVANTTKALDASNKAAYLSSLGLTQADLDQMVAELAKAKGIDEVNDENREGLELEALKSAAEQKGLIWNIKQLIQLKLQQKQIAKLNKNKEEGIVATVGSATAEGADAGARGVDTAAVLVESKALEENTKQTIRNKLVKMGLIGIIIAAAAAFIALGVAIVKSLVGESASAYAERMAKGAETAKQVAEAAKQQYQDLHDGLEELSEQTDAFEDLTVGTKEWYDQLEKVNNKVLELLKTVPELAQYLKVGANGELTLDEEGAKKVAEEKRANAVAAESAAWGAEAAADAAQARKLGMGLVGDESIENQRIARVLAGDQDAIAEYLSQGIMTEEQLALAQSNNLKDRKAFINQMGGYENTNTSDEYRAYGEALLKVDANKKISSSRTAAIAADILDEEDATKAAATAYALNLESSKTSTEDKIQQIKDAAIRVGAADSFSSAKVQSGSALRRGTNMTTEEGNALSELKTNILSDFNAMQEEVATVLRQTEGITDVEIDYSDGEITFKRGEDDETYDMEHIVAQALEMRATKDYQNKIKDFSERWNNLLNKYDKDNEETAKTYDLLTRVMNGRDLSNTDIGTINNNETLKQQIITAFGEGGQQKLDEILTEAAKKLADNLKDPEASISRAGATKKEVSEEYLKEEEELLVDNLNLHESYEDLADDYKDLTKEQQNWVSKAVAGNARVRKGTEELGKSIDKWKKLIKDDGTWDVFDREQQEVYDNYKKNFKEMLHITEEFKDEDAFYQNAENVRLLEDALKGSEKAYEELQRKATQEKIKLYVDKDTVLEDGSNAFNLLNNLIENFDFSDIKIGDEMPEHFNNICNELYKAGKINVEDLNSLYATLGFSLDISAAKGYWTNSWGARVGGMQLANINNMVAQGKTAEVVAQGYTYVPGSIQGTYTGTGYKSKNYTSNDKGGSDKSNLNLSQIDEYYNKLQRIASLEAEINKLSETRSTLLTKHTNEAKRYNDILKSEIANTEEQLRLTREMETHRLAQLRFQTDTDINGLPWRIQGKNSSGEDALINVSDYKKYVRWDEEEQQVKVDIGFYNSSTDEIKSNIDAVKGELENIAGDFRDYQVKALQLETKQVELAEEQRNAYIELEKTVADTIIAERQREIDALTAIDENINDAQSEIMDSIQKQIDLERQIRDNTKKEDEISDIENQIAFLSRDTSGANDVRIKELQKQLGDMTEEYSDTLVDQELQRITDANEKAQEQRERQIEILEKSLEYDQERGIIFAEAVDLINDLYDNGIVDESSEIWGRIATKLAHDNLTPDEIEQQLEEIKKNAVEAFDYTSNFKTVENFLAQIEWNTNPNNANNGMLLRSKYTDVAWGDLTESEMKWFNQYGGAAGGEAAFNYLTKTSSNLGFVTKRDLEALVEYAAAQNYDFEKYGLHNFVNNELHEKRFKQQYGLTSGNTGANVVAERGYKGAQMLYYTLDSPDLNNSGTSENSGNSGGDSGSTSPNHGLPIITYNDTQYSAKDGVKTSDIPTDKLSNALNYVYGIPKDITYNEAFDTAMSVFDKGSVRSSQVGNTKATENRNAIIEYMKNNYQYLQGGLASHTGPAWLDGTPNRPEYVLNPAQTEAFLQLPDLLRTLDLTAGQNVSYGDTSIEINIQVDQLASDYDVEQLAEKIKTEIYDDSAYRNVNSIGWIR